MINIVLDIFAHEKDVLLEALRRDLRSELAKSVSDTQDAHLHSLNARYVLRLLETLNPRGPHRAAYDAREIAALSHVET